MVSAERSIFKGEALPGDVRVSLLHDRSIGRDESRRGLGPLRQGTRGGPIHPHTLDPRRRGAHLRRAPGRRRRTYLISVCSRRRTPGHLPRADSSPASTKSQNGRCPSAFVVGGSTTIPGVGIGVRGSLTGLARWQKADAALERRSESSSRVCRPDQDVQQPDRRSLDAVLCQLALQLRKCAAVGPCLGGEVGDDASCQLRFEFGWSLRRDGESELLNHQRVKERDESRAFQVNHLRYDGEPSVGTAERGERVLDESADLLAMPLPLARSAASHSGLIAASQVGLGSAKTLSQCVWGARTHRLGGGRVFVQEAAE
jgi:hypothetical protein